MELAKTVDRIQQRYLPFNQIDGRLFGRNHDDALKNIVKEEINELADSQRQRVIDEYFAWGPIQNLLDHPGLNEIIINGAEHIYFEINGEFHRHDDIFLSPLTYRNFVQRLCQVAQCQLTAEKPYANGKFMGFRLHLTGPPICHEVLITLRKHLAEVLTLQDYCDQKTITSGQLKILQGLLKDRKNFLIVGNTGSGKTTLLNTLLKEIQTEERILVVEDTAEICLPNPLSVGLLTFDSGFGHTPEVTQQELVRQALRMRPDRIIMGEVRGAEAKDLLQALATGHTGSIGTIHANSPAQAIYRLEMLIQMGAPQWQIQAIRRLVQLSLTHLVVIQKRGAQRQIEGIYELASLEDFGFLINRVDQS